MTYIWSHFFIHNSIYKYRTIYFHICLLSQMTTLSNAMEKHRGQIFRKIITLQSAKNIIILLIFLSQSMFHATYFEHTDIMLLIRIMRVDFGP